MPCRRNPRRQAIRLTLIAALAAAVPISGVVFVGTAAAAPVAGPVAPSAPAEARAAADAAAAVSASATAAAAPLEAEYAKFAGEAAAAQAIVAAAQAKIDAAAAEEKAARQELFRAEEPIRQAERKVDAADHKLISTFRNRRALDNPVVSDVSERKAAVEKAEAAVSRAAQRVAKPASEAREKIETAEAVQEDQENVRSDAAEVAAKNQAQADTIAAGELSGLRANKAAADAASATAAERAQSIADTNPWFNRLVLPGTGHVTSPMGMRVHPVLGGHRLHAGIDFATGDGTVYAAANGTVVGTEATGAYGNLTTIDHGVVNGVQLTTRYAHQSAFGVAVGQQVTAGQPIGAIGATGRVTGPHLHFELRVNGNPVNPAPWLGV